MSFNAAWCNLVPMCAPVFSHSTNEKSVEIFECHFAWPFSWQWVYFSVEVYSYGSLCFVDNVYFLSMSSSAKMEFRPFECWLGTSFTICVTLIYFKNIVRITIEPNIELNKISLWVLEASGPSWTMKWLCYLMKEGYFFIHGKHKEYKDESHFLHKSLIHTPSTMQGCAINRHISGFE